MCKIFIIFVPWRLEGIEDEEQRFIYSSAELPRQLCQ